MLSNSLSGGGAERVVNLLANGIYSRGHQVVIVPINRGEDDLVQPVCEIFPLGKNLKGGIFSLVKSVINLNIFVYRWKPTVVILNCELPEFFGALILRKVKLITVEHTSFPWRNRPRLGWLVRQVLAIRKSVWVGVSEHLKPWPRAYLAHYSIPNPLTPNKSINFDCTGPILRLVFVGRLTYQKNPEFLLEAAASLNLPVRFIGEGEEKDSLAELAQQLGSQVDFVGRLQNPWLSFQPGDLLVIPSRWEGDGLVVIEALNNHLPLVLSGIPDLRRFDFPDKHYFDNLQSFIKLIRLNQMEIKDLRVTIQQTNYILAQRNLDKILNKWEALF